MKTDNEKVEDALFDLDEATFKGAIAAERERCANLVPTTWLDPLLSGKNAPKLPMTGSEVEGLLRGIKARILAND